jgi:hypothetical protein
MANIVNGLGQVKVGVKPTPPPTFVTSGLRFSYDAFNPTSYSGSGNTWYDISGNNRNMTIYPSVIQAGQVFVNGAAWNTSGGIKRFGFVTDSGYGSNSYGGLSLSDNITTGLTFGGWAKTNTYGAYTFCKGMDGVYGGWDMQFSLGATSLGLTILNTSYQGVGLSANLTLTNNTWYYIIGQYIHNVGLKIYVNGVLANTLNQTGLQMVNRGTGWTINAITNTIKGQSSVSTYHMYNRILTDSEISTNFLSQKSRYGY